MTTLIGICSEDKSEVVLAADRQASRIDQEGRFQYKHPAKKLYVDKDRKLVLGIAGVYDDNTQKLVENILEGKVDVEKVIAEEKFPELLNINLARSEGRVLSVDNSTSLLIATRYTSPKLFTCFPLGSIEPRGITYIGSGSKYFEEYLHAEMVINQARPEATILEDGKLSPRVAKDLAYRGVRHAAKSDPYSSGLDIVVVSANEIIEHGKMITEQEELAQKNIFNTLLEK